jgi:glutamyl-tRNA reductase
MKNILLIGMNHKTAPLEIRERLALTCDDDAVLLREMMDMPGIREAMFLATCNRVEVLARSEDAVDTAEKMKEFIFRRGNLPVEEMTRCLYLYSDGEAVRHLFRVASGIDSMIMGEPQILGQVKDAYRRAVEHNTTGIILNRILHHTFRTAKRVRTETGISGNAVSVSFAAVELAKKIFGDLREKTILIVGAGEMSELAAKHLINHTVGRIIIANRTYAKAVQMAELFHGTAIEFEQLPEKLQEADIVISSTGAPGYVITTPMISAALHRRRNRLLFLIDIAVPRDIDPEAGKIDNVYLYNIDNLQDIVDENLKTRKKEAELAETIIEEEIVKFQDWYNSLEVVPTIVSLKEKMESIVKGELAKSEPWLQKLTADERSSIEVMAASIINKILNDPIAGLKEESRDRSALPYIAALRRLFDLKES